MNILFCGDKNVSDGIMLSSLSVCEHITDALNIYILTAGITAENKKYEPIPKSLEQKLNEKLKEQNPESHACIIDITDIFGDYLPLANMKTRFTPLSMLRLFSDKVEKIPDRILYMDADVLCRTDFSNFYNQDMGGFEIAGALDRYGKWFFKKNLFKFDYINSGVLLLNMKKIRESGLFEKCRIRCRDKKMFMPDQTALNKLSEKKIIDRKYNEQGNIKKDTVFKHFTTYFEFFPYIHSVTVKPWQVERLHNKLKIFEFDSLIKTFLEEKEK